jgi:hypothetical protein
MSGEQPVQTGSIYPFVSVALILLLKIPSINREWLHADVATGY